MRLLLQFRTSWLRTSRRQERALDVRAGPLWHTTLYVADSNAPASLVLTIHHVLSDGVGSRNLLSELLRLLAQPSPIAAKHDVARAVAPPTLEATVDVRPSWMHLVHVVLAELLFPRLPAWLRPQPRLVWPNPPRVKAQTRPPRVAFLRIAAAEVTGLKTAAKAHGVCTLHPLLLAVSLYALWNAAGRPQRVQMDASTPTAERKPALGHPLCTGNYVSSHLYAATLVPSTAF